MKKISTLCFILFFSIPALAQDSILARIIFIGDAGAISRQQTTLLADAASRIIKDKTTVVFLGDNIYPRGMGLPGSKEEQESKYILQSQFQPMRKQGAAVYFIPGNHDWDRMGPRGLIKIKQQWAFLNEQNDSLLKMVPEDGCPDPVAIPVSDSLVIIAMDSEWWLFPFDKDNPEADCGCTSSADVIAALRELFYENRYKTILLATHHPFQSYATHGGYFSWKDHLFPLTALNPYLYIPLPVIGSIYPLYRKTFTNVEDLHHPVYQEMINDINQVFSGFPNLVHASGHDHGLQLIDNTKTGQMQVISGGGAKQSYTTKGKYSLFNTSSEGFVIADGLPGNRLHFTFFAYIQGEIKDVFDYTRTYQPYNTPQGMAVPVFVANDSVNIQAHPAYNRSGRFARFWLGENYRKEWAQPVQLPLLHISGMYGGLKPLKLGGGFQSTSLRLTDPDGGEYTLRSVEKTPDNIVPKPFRGTFVRELLDDATSAQHPYSALIVPPVAEALHVPHAHPVIGVVAPDKNLGAYQKLFRGKVTLLEEREPLGNSDNYVKALKKLQADNDNSYDAINFLKARMMDLLFADWDRHGDQWRFVDQDKESKHKYYIAIPRDRDMVLNVTQGVLPTLLKHFFVMPRVFGFRKNLLPGSNYYLYKSAFLNAHPASQIGYDPWMQVADSFKAVVTDSVLEQAMDCFPRDIDSLRNDQILADLKARRDKMPQAMDKYYRFSNRIMDIHTSNKNELVSILENEDSNGLSITISKINKHGTAEDTLMSKNYPEQLTKEVRIYLADGSDSVFINNKSVPIRLRIIGGNGSKAYTVQNSRKKIKIYDLSQENYYGKTSRIKKHIRNDSMQTAFVPVNLYNTYMPLVTGGINVDDGVLLGLGVQFMQQRGFRKTPYAALHKLMVSHSFSTKAFNIQYKGEWLHAIGDADITITGDIKAPENTQNFFGEGNETPFDKTGNYRQYYRTRFSLYELATALRWHGQKESSFSIGPAIQYYRYNKADNYGRFINNIPMLHSYDSAFISKEKVHAGLLASYILDRRDDKIFPAYGTYANIQLQGYAGLNRYSPSFIQLIPEISFYKSLNARQTVVLADRVGGGITLGKTNFYQAMFLGGGGNLLGFRKYRFAGQQALYNNLELRIALADFGNYMLRGRIGVSGFYDIGRVWKSGEISQKWHNGVGGGIYFAPAFLAIFRFYIGYSEEGWYPYFSMGFRF